MLLLHLNALFSLLAAIASVSTMFISPQVLGQLGVTLVKICGKLEAGAGIIFGRWLEGSLCSVCVYYLIVT